MRGTTRFSATVALCATLSLFGVVACGARQTKDADADASPVAVAVVTPAADAAPPAPIDAGCFTADPAQQRHGSTCLCCHSDEFSVGGSIDPNGPPVARIVVTDVTGDTRTMAPNPYGNVFAHFTLTPPLRAVAYGPDGGALAMKTAAPDGNCNTCHRAGGAAPPIHGP